jgi:hypothetical protein
MPEKQRLFYKNVMRGREQHPFTRNDFSFSFNTPFRKQEATHTRCGLGRYKWMSFELPQICHGYLPSWLQCLQHEYIHTYIHTYVRTYVRKYTCRLYIQTYRLRAFKNFEVCIMWRMDVRTDRWNRQTYRMPGSGNTMQSCRNYGPFKETHCLGLRLFRNVSKCLLH